MVELAFWHELRVPSPERAEERYLQIVGDEHPVPLGELDQRLQDFVCGVRVRAPEVRILELGHAAGEPLFSRLGIVVTFPDELTKQVYPKVVAATDEPRLHTYDRKDKFVMGIDTDPDIIVH
ncbi:hypothetical protein [Actinomadura sp. 7K507]|uniref:hypothetical protein n=1 Tax=Actinomadura sp. 7K507 TaxID=2530365 RepID=UPI0010533389|nr:hypothetical protein [Actinomadura sp. 7K507]TDC84783.1 hypothetical protein E1285_26175 [Actinomadura sp. 7K507]